MRKGNKKHRRNENRRLLALLIKFLTALCWLLTAIVKALDD